MFKTINYKNTLIIIILLIIMSGIILNAENSIASAKEGLYIWLNLLLPSLFPFIFISNLLISFGFVRFLGKFLEPIMRPVFNVSGSGIFPFLLSMLSGYPVGAKLSASLRLNNTISNVEGNRLISFSSTSGPLFILGTVMIGMLGVNAAPLFILPHYLAVITVGILFRFYGEDKEYPRIKDKEDDNQYSTLGTSMGFAVKDSMNSMLLIGGYVIIFTVIIDLLLGSPTFNGLIINISSVFQINPKILKGLLAGAIELTNGCYIVSNLNIDFTYKVLIINFLIGWGGFSINSQAISFISQTDLNIGIYLIGKVLHGAFSALYTYIIYFLFYKNSTLTVFLNLREKPTLGTWFEILTGSFSIVFTSLILLVLVSVFINEVRKRT